MRGPDLSARGLGLLAGEKGPLGKMGLLSKRCVCVQASFSSPARLQTVIAGGE